MNNHNNINGGARKIETNGGNGDPLSNISLTVDETFDVLAHPERRAIIEYLMSVPGGTVSISDLVTRLGKENTDPARLDSIKTRVYHSHLPKLVDLGIIECDARSEEIRYYCDERLETWLRHALHETID